MNMSKSKTCACLNLRGWVYRSSLNIPASRPNHLDKYSVPDSSVGNTLLACPAQPMSSL